jgi:ABC-2 type transport system permease protein
VDVEADVSTMALIFLSHLILQFEIAAVTFGLSAFLRRGELGLGLGLAFALYFINKKREIKQSAY